MRHILCSIGNMLFKPLKLAVIKKKVLDELVWEKESLIELYKVRLQQPQKRQLTAEGIVFSKDRALQLHALLGSYFEQVTSPAPLHVLYHASTPAHKQAYDEVIEIFPNVSFTQQPSPFSFRSDLLTILDALRSEKTFFLVDDMVYIEPFDMKDVLQFNPDAFILSLRLGENLTWCYTQQRQQELPPEVLDFPSDKFVWRWEEGNSDWGYPLSVDGHFFATSEIQAIAHQIHFHAPNTFEDSLQFFRALFSCRYGVCYRKSKVVNIPCNKVQQENKNTHGNIHQDDLLRRWQNGMQMDYRSLYGLANTSAHQEIAINFISR